MNKKMKSKSFDLKLSPMERGKNNKTFDFVGLYRSAAETNSILSGKPILAETQPNDSKNETPRRANKKKNKNDLMEVSQINIDGSNLNSSLGTNTPFMGTKVTSTPNPCVKSKSQVGSVKSIMKSKPVRGEDSMDSSQLDVSSTSSTKPKKRNKSVSFMLDENEEVVIKKTKSNDSLKVTKSDDPVKVYKKNKANIKNDKKKLQKIKKDEQSEKENNVSDINHMETDLTSANQSMKKNKINKKKHLLGDAQGVAESRNTNLEKKKKFKKDKKQKQSDSSEPTETNTTEGCQDIKNKKNKKKKHQVKPQTDSTETEGEPAIKSRKKDVKPELIAEDLENLSIGDNAHTLTNLLDDMMVVDKVKRKRLRQKLNRAKKQQTSETGDIDKPEGEKEKPKWKKRKWNKDKKGDVNEDLATTIIVEGLPLSIMLNYKTLLSEHFAKLGTIKKIGIAEVYPTEESRPVFTTTITFCSDEAAQLALDEDNSTFEGSRIRVKRPLPPTETTLVLRTYGDVTPQAVGALLTGAGKIRNIRHLVKGKKAMSSVFIEFDGPESVKRAIKLAEDAKIGGKKIHVSKFEIRKSKHEKKPKTAAESEGDESDDSN